MAYFRVMLGGTGIDVPSEENESSIIGFFTTRFVRGGTVREAERKAKDMVLSEWLSGEYARP